MRVVSVFMVNGLNCFENNNCDVYVCLMSKINFYAGPAILPQEVLQQAQEAVKDFAGTGLSILEISHRSKEFVKIMDEARALVRELMQLNDEREVLFLHGGGLSQFHMVPMNLLNENETASYFDTGTGRMAQLKKRNCLAKFTSPVHRRRRTTITFRKIFPLHLILNTFMLLPTIPFTERS